MKKYIVIRLVVLVLIIVGIFMSVWMYAMLDSAFNEFNEEANGHISQIEEILAENDETVYQLQEDLRQDFLIRANAVAYMIQYNQDVIYDIEQLEHIAKLLQIDEIHLFTPQGEIYSGNVPDYYGFTFESGEQMRFFLPMLYDYDLELAQDITPNTAESKEMQYVAVWSADRQHIVQIGIEPLRLLEAMANTELTHIFSRLTHSAHTMFFAVDATSGEVIISTNPDINGIGLSELGIADFSEDDLGVTLNTNFVGELGHVLIQQHSDSVYIGYYQDFVSIYHPVLFIIGVGLALSLVVSALIIALIYFMLDRVVLCGLFELEKGMKLIAGGDLEYRMSVTGLPELEALSDNVNFMVKRVVESSQKFSTIFEYVNVPIAMYECTADTVIASGKLAEILHISDERFAHEYKSPQAFIAFIEQIMLRPHVSESDVYSLNTYEGERYLKIMRYRDGESDWGLIVDSTDEINEKSKIKKERDLDFLTGLYGKRAFFEQLEALSRRPEETKMATVVMLDLDNLKYVNDTWGHETGDRFICAAANVLHRFEYDNKLCSRLSGDELAMVLYGAEDYIQLELQLERLKENFDKAYINTPTDVEHKVSASIGYALCPEQSESFTTCLNYADKAMYKAKSRCKGSVEKYEPSDHHISYER